MDLPGPTTDSQSALSATCTPVFSDNVQDLLGVGTLAKKPGAIITVNSIADVVDGNNGVTTLREAINQASADNGEDLIVFERSLFSTAQTITLSLGELDITHNISIIAPRDTLTGGDLVTVSGKGASRVFEIESGATVSLDGLIVADGNVMGDGGGIKNQGTLTLNSSIVLGGCATRIDYSPNGNGGGIYNSGSLTLNNSTVNDNTIDTTAIYKSSLGNGGGIYNSGSLTVNNSNIINNRITIIPYFLAYGGGIYNTSDGTVEVNNSTLSGNSAFNGGGIYNLGGLLLTNSTFSANEATSSGGGIYNNGNSVVNISNCHLTRNSAIYFGGGIENSGTVVLSNSHIDVNKASSDGGSGAGGGIYNTNKLQVSNSTINGNLASGKEGNGGGIYNGNSLQISNSIISANSAANTGGGIYNDNQYGGMTIVSNSTISDNTTKYGNGGGIYVDSRNSKVFNLTIIDTTISGNSAVGSGGGISYNSYTTKLTLLFSTITQNLAANGGGIYQYNYSQPSWVLAPNSVRNTIIAANLLSTKGVNPDVSGNFTSDGYNLIGDRTGSTGFDATGDLVGTSDNPIDPRLAPLDFYGGDTLSIALLPDSPAIDAGDPTVLNSDPTTDQRGFPRVINGRADIGAFEFL